MGKKDDDQFLADARERFAASQTEEKANRTAAIEDIRFENGEQWDEKAKADRIGRPCPVVNKVSGTSKQIKGDARQNRPRIKVRPVDSQADPKVAELLTGLIRNIENVSDADDAYDLGFDQAVDGGFGYWRILTDYASDAAFEQDILIRRIVNQFSVSFDQSATEKDYSDAKYCFVSETLRKEEFKAKYPNAAPVDWESSDGELNWLDGDKVRVAEYWYKEPTTKHLFELADGRVIEVKKPRIIQQPEIPPQPVMDPQTGQPAMQPGQPAQQLVVGEEENAQPMPFTRTRKVKCDRVRWAKITGSQILERPQEWAGKYIPIVPCIGEEVWIEGERVLRSAIRFAKEPARIYNWTRANSIEIMALGPKQPYLVTSKNIEGHEQQWKQAYQRPMPYLLYNSDGGPAPARQQLDVNTTGIHQEALLAADDIKATTGIYDASLGARGNETSGKAIIARQRQGDVATYTFSDNQVRAIKYTGRILVDLIPKIYDTQRVVRLMGDDLKQGFKDMQGVKISPDGQSAWAQVNVLGPNGQVVYNDLSVGRYDVVVEAGPGYSTKRMEAADGLVTVLQAAPNLVPLLLPDIAKNLDWPGAQELAEKLEKATQPQQAPPDPLAQIDVEKGKLDLQGKQLDLQGKQLDIAGKAQGMAQERQQQQQQQADTAGADQRMMQIAQVVASQVVQQALRGLLSR